MTPLVLLNARLIDPETGYDGPGAVRIEDGRIVAVAKDAAPTAPEGAEVIDCAGDVLAPGLIDMRVFVGEPGARHLESYRSAGRSAAAGGVTAIALQPDTNPVMDDPALVEFSRRRAAETCAVHMAPMAALTKGLEGREMAELAFLRDAGAVAFTDAGRAIANSVVLRRCLTYAKALDALVVTHAQEPALSGAGCATEGQFASQLGLPGVPAAAEEMQVSRDLTLAKLTGARLHADQITTADALVHLARAKNEGLTVSAGIAATHLAFNEFDIADYKTFFKLAPPLRAEMDREAAEQAVADGLIDVIVSNHRPWDEEEKRQPFEAAAPGAVGLETLLPTALRLYHDDKISLPALWERISLTPAKLLGLEGGRLGVGAPADLVLVNLNAPWTLDRDTLLSKSRNSPFDRRRLQGYALKTWVSGELKFDRAADLAEAGVSETGA